ncbi:hypothetical protein E5344_14650 [Microbacterium laevaniformans]|uniref:Uncharacterized protein n=1 Tax=Microbacterium laevaniformans TaxID=36807 RepID=A0A4S2CYS4_9MICO|nr:hypothetical protein [Microbacterium laevaniformans]TGY33283.1 hypothetical protein E5344_14650 [Microbacterium laevaniformans]
MMIVVCIPFGDLVGRLIAELGVWLNTVGWQLIVDGSKWVLSLGLLSTFVAAILTSRRDRLSRERERRSQLAQTFLEACVSALVIRLNGSASADDRSDAMLVFSHQMLIAANDSKQATKFDEWVSEMVRAIRFGQPPPTLEQIVAVLGKTMAAWVQDPAKVTAPST